MRAVLSILTTINFQPILSIVPFQVVKLQVAILKYVVTLDIAPHSLKF